MLKLALVDENDFHGAIEEWPKYQKMSQMEKRVFTRRVTMFRDRLRNEATEEARQLGLDIPEDRKVEYFRAYWSARMKLEQIIRAEAQERHKNDMGELRQKLQREW